MGTEPHRDEPREVRPRKVIASAAIGNFVEWYDFAIYGVAASILAKHFFPAGDPAAALISAYLLFGITYVSRPAGGLLAGWLGDTLGRRRALSFTILLMCAGTVLIGFIPSYSTIGIAAPIMLAVCRLIQGLGTGGEYSSAIAFVYEHSDPSVRPARISYLVTMTFLGITTSVLAASLCTAIVGEAAFEAWGWRILFLLSAPLGIIGVYLRNRVTETPEFARANAAPVAEKTKTTPIRTAFRTQAGTMVLFFCVVSAYALITPVLSSYFITFMQNSGGISHGQSYWISVVANLVMIAATLIAGRVMANHGLQRTFIIGGVFIAVVSVPAFAVSTHGVVGALVGGSLLSIGKGIVAVAGAMAMSYMFPAHVRVTAGAFAYNVCTITFGAAGPAIGLWLNDTTGTSTAFSVYLAVVGALSVVAAIIGRKRLSQPVTSIPATPNLRPGELQH
ncbi:MFS transporter [Streptomyces sp. RS2]|uniref:MFS transporter n=1 Tax=Streptomyces sp. RS2 TaxID=1451205 RepID=UPI0021F90B65|nr:MFS transporter [Streptomyces sp. RS2]MCW1100252.1 MFS transporter [Streptomyces sp. RS2]